MSLGENIYQHRIARNFSQSDLAEALEVSRQSVSKWENNSAVPDLDRLIKMSRLFEITLDELVFGAPHDHTQKNEPEKTEPEIKFPPIRIVAGIGLLMFGMIFFLLSVFWGDHLYFGEAFGELFSAIIVLLGIALAATHNFQVFSVCVVIYFLYSIVCFGLMHVTSLTNYFFTFVAGCVLFVWFIVYGLHATRGETFQGVKDFDNGSC